MSIAEEKERFKERHIDSIPSDFCEYVRILKVRTGLTWDQIADILGVAYGSTLLRFAEGKTAPSWPIFLKLCALGDQTGFRFHELIKMYLPNAYQSARSFNADLVLQIMQSEELDYVYFAQMDTRQFLSSVYAMSEITDMCLLCIAYWKDKANSDDDVMAHCKELAQVAARMRTASRQIIDLWHQNTPDSRERDIALQRYCIGITDNDLAAAWKINTCWIKRLCDRAISHFSEEIGVSSQAGDSL